MESQSLISFDFRQLFLRLAISIAISMPVDYAIGLEYVVDREQVTWVDDFLDAAHVYMVRTGIAEVPPELAFSPYIFEALFQRKEREAFGALFGVSAQKLYSTYYAIGKEHNPFKKKELEKEYLDDFRAYFAQEVASKKVFDVIAISRNVYLTPYDFDSNSATICWGSFSSDCRGRLGRFFNNEVAEGVNAYSGVSAGPLGKIAFRLTEFNSFDIKPTEDRARRAEGLLAENRQRMRPAIVYLRLDDLPGALARGQDLPAHAVAVDVVDGREKTSCNRLRSASIIYRITFDDSR